jgi:predicted XRE-type DNA-binding protein
MKLIHNDKLPGGSVIVFDELGVSMNARTWQSQGNRIMSYVLQTFRYKRLICIFTVPDLSFIDSTARRLVHAIFLTRHLDRKKQVCHVRPYFCHTNPLDGTVYKKFLKVKIRGHTRTIDEIGIKIPSLKLRHAYEKKKREFGEELYGSIVNDLGDEKKKEEKASTNIDQQKILVDTIMKMRAEGKKQKEIALALGTTRSTVAKIISKNMVTYV